MIGLQATELTGENVAIARQHAITVGVTPSILEGTQYPGWRMINNGSNTVFLGDVDVAISTGFPILAGKEYSPQEIAHKSFRGQNGDRLYGVVATGTEDVRVLIEGRVNP